MRAIGIFILSVIYMVLIAISCIIAGTKLFACSSTWQLYVRGLTYVLLLSFGVSVNMHIAFVLFPI